jgi:hypothetical protein
VGVGEVVVVGEFVVGVIDVVDVVGVRVTDVDSDLRRKIFFISKVKYCVVSCELSYVVFVKSQTTEIKSENCSERKWRQMKGK